jgi:hypothetical protein
MKIAIIGAGWNGCHLALTLEQEGHEVQVYEKLPEIFSKISGSFGIRLHAGPHYPRSTETRKSCHKGFELFKKTYPELIIPHEYSVYALGKEDADDNPPKVNKEEFQKVCDESESCKSIDMEQFGYKGLISAYNIDEPSIALGERLRKFFSKRLEKEGIEVHYNYTVTELKQMEFGVALSDGNTSTVFDKVINATSYQNLLPNDEDFPFDMEVIYQPCLALKYKDKSPGKKPFSFIVMDGWFPCMMPYICDDEDENNVSRNYILTHGKWTIMGSCKTPQQANQILTELNDSFVEEKIKNPSAKEMIRFWPNFEDRFEYIGWKGEVLAKIKTRREFRSAVTYEKNNVIHIVPGKVSNIFDVETEVNQLITRKNTIEHKGYFYIEGGVLDSSHKEISEKPWENEICTTNLQTFDELRIKVPLNNNPNLSFFPPIKSKLHTSESIENELDSLEKKFIANDNILRSKL